MSTLTNRLRNGRATAPVQRGSAGAGAELGREIEQSTDRLARTVERVETALAANAAEQSQHLREGLAELQDHLLLMAEFIRQPLQEHVRKLNAAGGLTTAQRERFRDLFRQLEDELRKLEGVPLR